MRGGARPNSGPKIGAHTLLAAEMKKRLIVQLEKNWDPIVAMAIKQARRGDGKARDWLSIRAMGVPAYTDESGENFMPFQIIVKCNGNPGSKFTSKAV